MARPRKHDRAKIVRAVCVRIGKGALVKDAAKEEGTTADQIRDWAAADPGLSALYARARVDQAHALADETLALADTAHLSKTAIAKARLQVDTRKWYVSKIAPRLYGEKLEISSDPERPLVVQLWQFGEKKVAF